MNSMEEIQIAISGLSANQRDTLAAWLLDSGAQAHAVREPAAAYDVFSEDELISVEEYLRREEKSQIRHEYVAGRVYAMSGASLRHNVIAQNLTLAFSRHLAGGPCRAFMIDVKLRFQVSRADVLYYPDVVVACGSLNLEDKDLRNPKLVIEVLSPSTAYVDKREKAFNYRQIDSLEEYIIVAQAEPDVTSHRRVEGWKPRRWRQLTDVIELSSISLALPLTSVYDSVFTQ